MAINFLSGIDVDNGVLYTDTANNRVGIGTTSPSEKLHVYNGTAYVTPVSYAANQSAFALRVGAYNSTSFDMGLQLKSTSGGSPYMSFKTSSTDDVLTIWGSSVGIGGIGIPSYTLDVDGQIRGEQYLYLKDTGGTNRFSIRAESTYGTIDNGSNTLNYNASNHLFLVGLSEKMRIDSAGNVGIGTTSPQEKLHVQNYTTGESHQAMFKGGAVTIGDYSYISLNNGYGTEYNKEVRLAAVAELAASNKTGFAILTSPDSSGASGHERLRVTADGDVGIGITSPSFKLDVGGTLRAGSLVSGELLRLNDSSATGNPFLTFYQSNTRRSFIQHVDSGDNLKLASEYGGVQFFTGTGGAETVKMVIQSGGNVGIGTTIPSQKFHVNGTALVESTLYIDDTSTSLYRYFNELIIQNTASTSVSIGGGPGSVTNNLEVNGVVTATAATDAYKGYIKSVVNSTPLMKSANTNYNYLPFNTTIFGTTADYYNRITVPYNGRIKKITLRHIPDASGTVPTATGLKFKFEKNGSVIATEYTATVTGGASANFLATYNFGNSDFTFTQGDYIGVLVQTSGGTGSIIGASAQIVFEYNIT